MSLTLELPLPLKEELEQEAEKEGVSPSEHATLLLYLMTALLEEKETTPFRDAVKAFLSYHSLDVNLVSAAFEELVQQCLAPQDKEKNLNVFQKALSNVASGIDYKSLREWRNLYVHQPVDVSFQRIESPLRPEQQIIQRVGRVIREQTAMGKYAHIPGSSEDFATEKQKDIIHEDRQRH